MKKNIGFRGWYYFRTGWSVYLAFIFAAINTLTVTYFLVIENYPILKEIFPSFLHYIVIVSMVGMMNISKKEKSYNYFILGFMTQRIS